MLIKEEGEPEVLTAEAKSEYKLIHFDFDETANEANGGVVEDVLKEVRGWGWDYGGTRSTPSPWLFLFSLHRPTSRLRGGRAARGIRAVAPVLVAPQRPMPA